MNFTREPIIETIITPKDGYKLVVRNSKGGSQEEYHVDAVEVVSFGHSFFFRSLERPKSFLVPVSDYEIIETKETRVVLKNMNIERSIKIGGGRQEPSRKEASADEAGAGSEETVAEASPETPQPFKNERKRERRRHRRGRRSQEERSSVVHEAYKETPQPAAEVAVEGGGANDETQVSSSMFTSLFSPPPTLISETIGRYKEKNAESAEGDLLPEPVTERKKRKREEENPAKEESAPSDPHLHHVSEEDSDYFLI